MHDTLHLTKESWEAINRLIVNEPVLTLKDWLPVMVSIFVSLVSVGALFRVTRKSNLNALKIARQSSLIALQEQFEVELREIISELTVGMPKFLALAAKYRVIMNTHLNPRHDEYMWDAVYANHKVMGDNAKFMLMIKHIYPTQSDGIKARKVFIQIFKLASECNIMNMAQIAQDKFDEMNTAAGRLINELHDVYVEMCSDARANIFSS